MANELKEFDGRILGDVLESASAIRFRRHFLDMSTGEAALAFRIADGVPWHELGKGMTVEQARNLAGALSLAGLNFEVDLTDSFGFIPNPAGDALVGEIKGVFTKDPEKRVLYRKDTGVVLGTVGTRYRVLQNKDGLGNSALQQLFDEGLAEVVAAGAIYGGREVWLQTIFRTDSPLIRQVYGENAVIPTALFYNSHDGSKAAGVLLTMWRVICRNSFRLAKQDKIGDAISVRHSGDVNEKMGAAARKLFEKVFAAIERSAAEAAVLKATHLTEEELGRLVLDLIAPKPEEEPTSARGKTFAAKNEERRNRVKELWTTGDGHEGDHSAWEALQAVTQSFDHEPELWGRGDADTRAFSHMHGDIAAKKVQVVTSLLDFAVETTSGLTMLDRILRYQSGDGNKDLLKQIIAVN